MSTPAPSRIRNTVSNCFCDASTTSERWKAYTPSNALMRLSTALASAVPSRSANTHDTRSPGAPYLSHR